MSVLPKLFKGCPSIPGPGHAICLNTTPEDRRHGIRKADHFCLWLGSRRVAEALIHSQMGGDGTWDGRTLSATIPTNHLKLYAGCRGIPRSSIDEPSDSSLQLYMNYLVKSFFLQDGGLTTCLQDHA